MINTVLLCLCTCNSLWLVLTSEMFCDCSCSGICICTAQGLSRISLEQFWEGLWVKRDIVLFKYVESEQLLCSREPGTVGVSWQLDQAKLFCAMSGHHYRRKLVTPQWLQLYVVNSPETPSKKCSENAPSLLPARGQFPLTMPDNFLCYSLPQIPLAGFR